MGVSPNRTKHREAFQPILGELTKVTVAYEHVAAANQLLGAAGVQNRAGIHFRRNLERDPRREVRLDRTGDHVHARALRSHDQVNAHRPSQLRQSRDRHLHFLSGRHDQVGKLVNHEHDERQVLVTLLRIQPPRDELLVVFLDVSRSGFLQQLVTVVHLDTERVQGIDNLFCICDDRLFLVRQLREEVLLDETSLQDEEITDINIASNERSDDNEMNEAATQHFDEVQQPETVAGAEEDKDAQESLSPAHPNPTEIPEANQPHADTLDTHQSAFPQADQANGAEGETADGVSLSGPPRRRPTAGAVPPATPPTGSPMRPQAPSGQHRSK